MVNLITGHRGTAHITAADAASINKALYGNKSAVVEFENNLSITLLSSNEAAIGTGLYYMQGRWIRVESSETISFDNGEVGYNRNDIVAMQYSQDASTGIEEAKIVIVKGNSVTGTATDPELISGDIDNGDILNQQALYRIPITGINVGTPIPMFATMKLSAEYDADGNKISDTYAKKTELGDQLIVTVTKENGVNVCRIERKQ